MRIYISARNMYSEETKKIAGFLEKHGHVVYYAAKDTPQNIPDDQIFLNNLVLIRNADVFIGFFTKDGHYGIDFAVEVGMASEAGKRIIGYVDVEKAYETRFYEKFRKDVMLKDAFTGMFTDLEEFGRYLLEI